MPIRLDLDVQKLVGHKEYAKDPILGHYKMDGNIAEQEIYGTPSNFKFLKNAISLKKTNQSYSRLMVYINRLLKDLR
jgi:hypothetical protein